MKNKISDFVIFVCFILALVNIFMNENFGFTPINGSFSLGENTYVVLVYLGAIYFVWKNVKNLLVKKNKI